MGRAVGDWDLALQGAGAWGRAVADDAVGELDELLFRQADVISRDQASRFLSRKAIRYRVAAGRWRRVHGAVFVTHSGPVGAAQRRWIGVLAAGPGAVLGGLTAAQDGGLRGFPSPVVHVLVPAERRVGQLPPGVRVHRTVCLSGEDVVAAGRPRRTVPARSLVDAAQWADSAARARAVIAAGFQQRLVGGGDVHRVLVRLPRVRRRRLILETATDAAGGAHSLAELDFLGLVRRAGLPEPRCQQARRDSTGRRRYLDAYFERWGLHVEIDGGQHLDPQAAWADMRRQNDLWIDGDRVLRFPAWVVRVHPRQVVDQVRAALRQAGWPG
ncbi:DUF559 domain-containing protein [Micromonospora sp. NPDC000207]|uniref:DUF559 domain-containing protein n=1 Tax=Micromonospora sp. NPDC000207 TaxID=3154246 RepID=UPI00332AAC65